MISPDYIQHIVRAATRKNTHTTLDYTLTFLTKTLYKKDNTITLHNFLASRPLIATTNAGDNSFI